MIVTNLPGLLIAGTIALAATSRMRGARPHLVAAVPGAALVAASVGHEPGAWYPWAVGAAVVVVGPALADTSSRYGRSGVLGVLLAVTAGAAYLTTPDTELARLVLGILAPMSVAGLLARRAAVPRAVAPVLAGLLVWSVATDAQARPASLLAAVACFGFVVAEPAGRAVMRSIAREPGADPARRRRRRPRAVRGSGVPWARTGVGRDRRCDGRDGGTGHGRRAGRLRLPGSCLAVTQSDPTEDAVDLIGGPQGQCHDGQRRVGAPTSWEHGAPGDVEVGKPMDKTARVDH